MTEEQQKEELSVAYTWAIAAKAGFSCSRPSVDDDSVDLTVTGMGMLSSQSIFESPSIDFQLKATSQQKMLRDNALSFPLSIKNYNDLRRKVLKPRFLVVLLLPEAKNDWLVNDENQFVAKKCAYFHSLMGLPETANKESVTIQIPRKNILTPDSLHDIMVLASEGRHHQ